MLAIPTNHFLSRVQTVAHFQVADRSTALCGNHSTVFRRGTVFMPITSEPMWLEVLHAKNVQNRNRRRESLRFRDPEAVLALCGISPEALHGFHHRNRRGTAGLLGRIARYALRVVRRRRPERA